MRRLSAVLALAVAGLPAADLNSKLAITRPVRPWNFVDAVSTHAGIWGNENGNMEAWVYPLKVCRDLTLEFRIDDNVVPAASVAREITRSPGRFVILYTGDDFRVSATYTAAHDSPGALIQLDVHSFAPLEIRARFRPDFQLMWPASIGTGYAQWDKELHAYRFGADGFPYAAVVGSPDAKLISADYETNYFTDTKTEFSLGTVNGTGSRVIAIAGSMKSPEEAEKTWRALAANPGAVVENAGSDYQKYLERTVSLDLPDAQLERAYDWSRLSMFEGLVDNPFMGRGLVAGIGPAKTAYRPGFAWFFGRDSFWTSFALISAGDFENAAAAIRFIAQFQHPEGKVPHEIAQTATLVDWFRQFPYGYASADATPLFIIIVRDYTEASGDHALANELWPRLTKALDFMRANADPLGFPKNEGVGHGWIEGGPLVPVRTEYYQAALGVEAWRSLAVLAGMHGDAQMAANLENEYRARRDLLERTYWDEKIGAYSYAIGTDGKQRDLTYSIATVPMWWDLAEPAHARKQIELLSAEVFDADWGERIISRLAPEYGPEGYHFGTVWPLFTGWTSVGDYRYHAAQAGWANLHANSELTFDGLGNTTEVLSGLTDSPLSTASPHQIWSAAMVVSPLLRGLFGLEVDAANRRVTLKPHLPASWDHYSIRGVRVADSTLDFAWHDSVLDVVNHGNADVTVHYAPAFAPSAIVAKGTREESGPADVHYAFSITAHPGTTTTRIDARRNFGYELETAPLELGSPGVNAKVIDEEWPAANEVAITLGGWPGRTYTLHTYKDAIIASVEGGQYDAQTRAIHVAIPAGPPGKQSNVTVRIHLR